MVKESSRHRFWNLQWKFLCLQTLHTYIRLLIFRSILTLALKTTRLIAALLSKKIYFKLLQGCEDFRISNRTTQRRQEWPPNLHPWESATLSDLVLSGKQFCRSISFTLYFWISLFLPKNMVLQGPSLRNFVIEGVACQPPSK